HDDSVQPAAHGYDSVERAALGCGVRGLRLLGHPLRRGAAASQPRADRRARLHARRERRRAVPPPDLLGDRRLLVRCPEHARRRVLPPGALSGSDSERTRTDGVERGQGADWRILVPKAVRVFCGFIVAQLGAVSAALLRILAAGVAGIVFGLVVGYAIARSR